MADDIPLQAQIDLWRQQVVEGTITDDQLRQAVATIRAGRIAASQLGATRRAKKGPARSAEDLLAGFMGDEDETLTQGNDNSIGEEEDNTDA